MYYYYDSKLLVLHVTQEEVTASSQDLRTVIQKLSLSEKENSNLLVAVTAREFKDLLPICTILLEGTVSTQYNRVYKHTTYIYSGENKYLNPYRFRKFGHLQRNV